MNGKVSAVLFVKNLAGATAFYQEVLNARPGDASADHATLHCGAAFALVLHQIPRKYADNIQIDTPPKRREQAAVKLCYAVNSIERARKAAAKYGGMLDASPPAWVVDQQKICLGHDPEGNVFQVNED